MEQFATEEQQVEAIKKFWKENGLAIVAGIVLGLGGLYGWRWYNDTQIQQKEQASAVYAQIVEELANDNVVQAKEFVATNNNGYAMLTALRLAKMSVDKGELEAAITQLEKVAANTDVPVLASLANLRLARIKMQLENFDGAMAALASVKQDAFSAQVDNIKGDIYSAQQQVEKARQAYQASLEKDDANQLVKMKLDNLGVASNG